MDYQKESIRLHRKARGKISVEGKLPVRNRMDLSLAYTPGVAGPSLAIFKDKRLGRELTSLKCAVAIISDGSAVLGLGNIGPEAALPVMEGKALLFKRFAGLDGVPLVLGTQDTEEIIAAVRAVAPTFGGINLEDISAPRCFEIERRLIEELSIPVMHDDQHGTAVVVLAGLINACKVTKRTLKGSWVVVNGVGAAGVATMRLIKRYAPEAKILAVDSLGVVWSGRKDLNEEKVRLIKDHIIFAEEGGDLEKALIEADIFIGVSKAGALKPEYIARMNTNPIVFALANPVPEIMPDSAKRAGARVVASGRSDFPNQINNVLAYPGIFKGVIESNKARITDDMKIAAAKALAGLVKKPTADKIIPDPFEKKVVPAVARAVGRA
jgi:malate dehydrogenase (oxaloacetate-decarboxylating)